MSPAALAAPARAGLCAAPSIRIGRGVMGIAAPLPSRRARAAVVQRAGLEDSIDKIVSQLAVLADVADAVAPVTDAVPKEPDNGFLGFLAGPLEAALNGIEKVLEGLNVPYAYGFSIIVLTLAVKLVTWPLSQKQVESTISLQVLQPKIKELQAKFGSNQEQLQLETARLYREAEVNPLAGCLPTLVTLPVWIGLYRALTNAADQGLLKEGFFWIPTLSGPVSAMDRQGGSGLSWLFPFEDGQPPVGWHDAGAYLILPVLLILSQYASQKIISPQTNTDDPSQKQVQLILQALPLMLGWFSLNVPSGLTLYWLVNNVLTTGQQVILRNTLKPGIEASITQKIQAIEARSKPVVLSEEERQAKEVRKGGTGKGKEMGARKKKGDKFRARKAAESGSEGKSGNEGKGEREGNDGGVVKAEGSGGEGRRGEKEAGSGKGDKADVASAPVSSSSSSSQSSD